MYYYFSTDITEVSYIILGDMGGSVIIMSFNPMDRGPFKQQTTRDTFVLRYSDAVKVRRALVSCYISNIFWKKLSCQC